MAKVNIPLLKHRPFHCIRIKLYLHKIIHRIVISVIGTNDYEIDYL